MPTPHHLLAEPCWASLTTGNGRSVVAHLIEARVPLVLRKAFDVGELCREHVLILEVEKRGAYYYLGYKPEEMRRVAKGLAEAAAGCGFVRGMVLP